MNIRLLGRDEIPLIWQIDRRDTLEMFTFCKIEN
jgi:hypothetical protein